MHNPTSTYVTAMVQVASLLSWRLTFYLRPVHRKYVVDEVAKG